MKLSLVVRDERPDDVAAIGEVTRAAFADHPFSQQTEQFIIEALRAAGALALSLVAELDGRVVGHIAFSRVTISDGSQDWYGLGPVSVLPAYQRQGIGKALINEGISRLRIAGMRGCVLVGEPEYYERFGFRNIPGLVYEGVPQRYVLALPLSEPTPRGVVVFHEGFAATASS